MRVAIAIIAVLATSGCELFTGPDLAERLLGQYEEVHIQNCGVGEPSCPVYVGAELEFHAGGQCRFQRFQAVFGADTTQFARCQWRTTGDGAEMSLAGGDWKRVSTHDLESGYITVVFREGCPDLVFDPCGPDWLVFRRKR